MLKEVVWVFGLLIYSQEINCTIKVANLISLLIVYRVNLFETFDRLLHALDYAFGVLELIASKSIIQGFLLTGNFLSNIKWFFEEFLLLDISERLVAMDVGKLEVWKEIKARLKGIWSRFVDSLMQFVSRHTSPVLIVGNDFLQDLQAVFSGVH